jgi:hypothetical protein
LQFFFRTYIFAKLRVKKCKKKFEFPAITRRRELVGATPVAVAGLLLLFLQTGDRTQLHGRNTYVSRRLQ